MGCPVEGCVIAGASQPTTEWKHRCVDCGTGVHKICFSRLLGQEIIDADVEHLCSLCHAGTKPRNSSQAQKITVKGDRTEDQITSPGDAATRLYPRGTSLLAIPRTNSKVSIRRTSSSPVVQRMKKKHTSAANEGTVEQVELGTL